MSEDLDSFKNFVVFCFLVILLFLILALYELISLSKLALIGDYLSGTLGVLLTSIAIAYTFFSNKLEIKKLKLAQMKIEYSELRNEIKTFYNSLLSEGTYNDLNDMFVKEGTSFPNMYKIKEIEKMICELNNLRESINDMQVNAFEDSKAHEINNIVIDLENVKNIHGYGK